MTRRWLLGQVAFLALSAGLLLLVFENSSLDLLLARPFFDEQLNDFPLRKNSFFNPVFYYGFKFAVSAAGVMALAICLFACRGRLLWLPKKNAWLALLGLILIPSAVALLKLNTNRHCPWDIAEFGGFAPYLGLLADMPEGIVRGVCFPAAHAATGFMWLAVGLALHTHSPQLSRRVVWGALVLGVLMGLTRQAQGGHFVSHTLWSAWLAWAISLGLAAMLGLAARSSAERTEHQTPDRRGEYQTQ